MARHCLPCVGLVMFVGFGLFVIAPDPEFETLALPPPAATLPATPPPRRPALPVPPHSPDTFPTVVLDAGHGGNDEGCRGHGLKEKELALDVALRVEQILRDFDVPVVLTRRDDRYLSLAERAAVANALDRAIFVSIHFNQSRAANADGIETYFADVKIPPEFAWTWVGLFGVPADPSPDFGEALAGFVQASTVTKVEARNRGIKARGLYVVRHVNAPSILIEAGFLSSALEAQELRNEDYRDRLAAGIAEGVLEYLKTQRRMKPRPELAMLRR